MTLALKKLGRPYAKKATSRRQMHVRDGWTDWRHRRTDAKNATKKRIAHRAGRKAVRIAAKQKQAAA